MNAGQRVDAIRHLAAVMSDWSYGAIDMVFKQFGVPWSDRWDGSQETYLMHYLGEADDSSLMGLEGYFGSGESTRDAAADVWSGDLFRLFLSHSCADKTYVSELKAALRSYGIEGFVAHEDIEPTAEWLRTISAALDTCDALAAVLTDDSRRSDWCDQEVGYCIGMRKLIVPLSRGCMPYGFMGRYQALKCKDSSPAELARQTANILLRNPLTSARMAEAVVANLECSASFAEAKSNIALVKRIKVWTPDMLRRLEGCTRNSQVSDAFGVPTAIQRIVSEHASPSAETGEETPF